MIGNNHENDLISQLETLKDITEPRGVMHLLISGLIPGLVSKTDMKAKDSPYWSTLTTDERWEIIGLY